MNFDKCSFGLALPWLGPSVRKQIVADLTALDEACLIDLGRN